MSPYAFSPPLAIDSYRDPSLPPNQLGLPDYYDPRRSISQPRSIAPRNSRSLTYRPAPSIIRPSAPPGSHHPGDDDIDGDVNGDGNDDNLDTTHDEISDHIRLIHLTKENAQLKREVHGLRVKLETISYVLCFFFSWSTPLIEWQRCI